MPSGASRVNGFSAEMAAAITLSLATIQGSVSGWESDEYQGRPISHFEIYLEAMEQVKADTRAIRHVVSCAPLGVDGLSFEGVPAAAKEFVETYPRIRALGHVRFFMESHVFAVWDRILAAKREGRGLGSRRAPVNDSEGSQLRHRRPLSAESPANPAPGGFELRPRKSPIAHQARELELRTRGADVRGP